MINLDTERLEGLLGRLSGAAFRMDEAAQLLMQVTTHEDWGCPERHTINDFILRNRSEMQRAQADGHSFLAASRASAQSFLEAEQSIGALFETLEGLLSGILADPVGKVGGNVGALANQNVPGAIGQALSGLTGGGKPGILGAFEGIRRVGLDGLRL